MKAFATPGGIDTDEYGVHRWWPYADQSQGAYFLIVKNYQLYTLQNHWTPHVICVVDDFGDLVRRGWQ